MAAEPTFDELLRSARRRALHLELRDVYMASPRFLAWKAGEPLPQHELIEGWHRLIGELTRAGVDVRRARVVSEPISEYVRFEYEMTPGTNLAAGERVRWLPRHEAPDIAVPLNDFWLLDDRVLLHYFDGAGEWAGHELSNDPALVELCASAFDAVWERGIDHEDYKPV